MAGRSIFAIIIVLYKMLVRITWLCSREKAALQTLKFFNIVGLFIEE